MKINEVAALTGLTKKAIHFYIREGLLNPESNAENRYYEFSSQDIQTLQNICLLRQLDIPVAEVKKMLANPQMSCYFLHELLENLRPELHGLMHKVQKLIYLLDTLPPKTDVDFLRTNSLAGQLTFESQIDQLYDLYFHDENAAMLSILTWGPFLNVPSTEYRSYLWKRLVDLARAEIDGSLRRMYHYYMALDWSMINEESICRYHLTMKVANLTPDTMEDFHQTMLTSLRALSLDEDLKERWKLVYRPILLPLMEFCQKAGTFISEYNPCYPSFYHNSLQCCRMVLDDFSQAETDLLRDLEQGLDGMFDLTLQGGCVLTVMYMFAPGPFSILSPAQVEKLM